MTPQTAHFRHWAAVRLLPGLLLAALFLISGYRLPVADAADRPVATAARVAGDETRTRFVADLTAPVGYTVYVLSNPYRVMIDLPQVVLAPHIGSATRETRQAMCDLAVSNLEAFYAGRPLLSPVPECR